MAAARVLVTGGSGFIGGWCVLAALDAGHDVRTTVRNVERAMRCGPNCTPPRSSTTSGSPWSRPTSSATRYSAGGHGRLPTPLVTPQRAS